MTLYDAKWRRHSFYSVGGDELKGGPLGSSHHSVKSCFSQYLLQLSEREARTFKELKVRLTREATGVGQLLCRSVRVSVWQCSQGQADKLSMTTFCLRHCTIQRASSRSCLGGSAALGVCFPLSVPMLAVLQWVQVSKPLTLIRDMKPAFRILLARTCGWSLYVSAMMATNWNMKQLQLAVTYTQSVLWSVGMLLLRIYVKDLVLMALVNCSVPDTAYLIQSGYMPGCDVWCIF